uniref:Uncharacterized protein n=1 Tax=Rhodnius prolixus TaxID=13249 RepID=T1HHR7_RHOPR
MKIEEELPTFPSTYQRDYKWIENVTPSKQFKDFDPYQISEEDKDNFIKGDIITSLSEEEKQKILKEMWAKIMKSVYGVDYSLKLLGSCLPRYYYMGLTDYQDTFSRGGYWLLKAEADKGYWRIGPKKIPEIPKTEIKCKIN